MKEYLITVRNECFENCKPVVFAFECAIPESGFKLLKEAIAFRYPAPNFKIYVQEKIVSFETVTE